MHSLATKLTAGFLLVGVLGAVLVALITGYRVRTEFDRFMADRGRGSIVEILGMYYSSAGSWEDVAEFIAADRRLRAMADQLVIVDEARGVAYGVNAATVAQLRESRTMMMGWPIEVGGTRVGVLLVAGNGPLPARNSAQTPEVTFVNNVRTAAVASAGIAVLLALVLGVLLARTLVRPVRELTAATQAMAAGKLGLQVTVRAQDEIGRLAASFNQMSTDLAQAEQRQKQMTADIAHDLRTPLSILRGYTEGLQSGALTGTAELYDIMHGEVTHLERLVNDLRTLSLADTGALSLNRRPVDPRALLERTGLKYVMQAEQQGVTLRIDAPDDLPSIAADLDRMTQVLNNLVSNALAHTPQGEIVLAARAEGSDVVLDVRDSGTGIDPADLPHVFDRFYRADQARQRDRSPSAVSASGLGLTIAKALVEAHGGAIAVASEPGQGAIFTIRLPAVGVAEKA